jgi:glycosyltransferase involved in cell wall biosynthesis
MYVNPIGNSLLEWLYRVWSNKVIFDLEDNRLLGASKETKGIAQILRGTGKTKFLVKTADHVITSSPALNDICLQINEKRQSTYISSSIDTNRFIPNNKYANENKVTIGWTGTFSTRPYLDLLRPVFIELKKQRDFKLIVIGNFEYDFPEMDIEVIQWTAEKEVEDLQKIDIGVYPLPLDDWVMGKSGLKAIQYMSFGLPCVATDISTVQQFIVDGLNGFLVRTDDEWVDKLVELIDSPALRKKAGENARQTVLEKFSKHVVKKQYLSVLESVNRID